MLNMANTRRETKELETPVVRPPAEVDTNMNASKMSTLKSSLQSLLRKLAYYDKSTAKILNENKKEQLQRQRKLIREKLDMCLDLIQEIQGLFIDLEEGEEVIDEWTKEAMEGLEPYENSLEYIETALTTIEQEIKEKQDSEQLQFQARIKARLRQEEDEAEEAKQERQKRFALELETEKLKLSETRRVQTKLPDLQISRFQGNHLDWVRFWSLFQTQIDEAPMSDEAKFSYLKEFVIQKVRATIEKLPVDSEGYKRGPAREAPEWSFDSNSARVGQRVEGQGPPGEKSVKG